MPPKNTGGPVDPRKPSAEKRFVRKRLTDEELPLEWFAMLSILCSMAGIWSKQRILSWAGAFLVASSLANIRYTGYDSKQIMSATLFASLGLLLNYFGPQILPPVPSS
eukprot:EC123494.1.p2 GENE.EC123494.1~~EC123494.1.p2  ORF type:complete len:108 (+),score=10.80 EC123494.1:120-443(+)